MEGILAIVLLFGTPVVLGGMGVGLAIFHSSAKRREREGARRTYERLMQDKLDVIRTAVAMGYNREDISHLDERLEKLVGADKLAGLLNDKHPTPPSVDSDMLDTDIDAELNRLKQLEQG